MPCYSDYMERNAAEAESAKVIGFLKELGVEPTGPSHSYYGAPRVLDQDTAKLCAWLRKHPKRIKSLPLEIQIWWRDHQLADARHEQEERASREREAKKKAALDKLTDEDKRALGLV